MPRRPRSGQQRSKRLWPGYRHSWISAGTWQAARFAWTCQMTPQTQHQPGRSAAQARLLPGLAADQSCTFAAAVPGQDTLCSACGAAEAVLRCLDCGCPTGLLSCGACDGQKHPHAHFHRRQMLLNGFWEPVAPSARFTADGSRKKEGRPAAPKAPVYSTFWLTAKLTPTVGCGR